MLIIVHTYRCDRPSTKGEEEAAMYTMYMEVKQPHYNHGLLRVIMARQHIIYFLIHLRTATCFDCVLQSSSGLSKKSQKYYTRSFTNTWDPKVMYIKSQV
jgi:hypothetical protein